MADENAFGGHYGGGGGGNLINNNNRRVTLGTLSQNQGNRRATISTTDFAKPFSVAQTNTNVNNASVNNTTISSMAPPGRMSLGVPANRVVSGPSLQQQPRRSSVGVMMMPRKSSLQGPRGSSLLNNTTVLRVADPRNLGDKQFLNDSIRSLLKYLTEHNFDHSLSPKMLSRPSNKEFGLIVLFLFKQYDPNFTLTGKFEDEVVSMFKQIGYPCQLSKANITAAGTPHAWPSLLAALVWLVDVLQYGEASDPSGFGTVPVDPHAAATATTGTTADADDKAATQSAFYAYLPHAYSLYMMGEDGRLDELEAKFISNFEAKNLLIKDEIMATEQRNQMCASDIEECERRRTLLPELEKKKKEYQLELNKYQQLMETLQQQRVQLQTKLYARQSEVDKLTSGIHAVNEDINALKSKIATQAMSPEDVKRLNMQKEQLEDSLKTILDTKYQLQHRVHEMENQLRQQVETLAETANQYNHMAEDLKLIPSTARNAQGKQFAIVVDVKAKRKEELVQNEQDIRNVILMELQNMKKEIMETTTSIKSEIINDKELLEELLQKQSTATATQNNFETKLKRINEMYQHEKTATTNQEQTLLSEIEALENRVLRLSEMSVEENKISLLQHHLEELKGLRSIQQQQHQRRRNEMQESILEIVSLCANHRERAQQRLHMLRDQFSERLEDCLWSRGPTAALHTAINNAVTTTAPATTTTTTTTTMPGRRMTLNMAPSTMNFANTVTKMPIPTATATATGGGKWSSLNTPQSAFKTFSSMKTNNRGFQQQQQQQIQMQIQQQVPTQREVTKGTMPFNVSIQQPQQPQQVPTVIPPGRRQQRTHRESLLNILQVDDDEEEQGNALNNNNNNNNNNKNKNKLNNGGVVVVASNTAAVTDVSFGDLQSAEKNNNNKNNNNNINDQRRSPTSAATTGSFERRQLSLQHQSIAVIESDEAGPYRHEEEEDDDRTEELNDSEEINRLASDSNFSVIEDESAFARLGLSRQSVLSSYHKYQQQQQQQPRYSTMSNF